MIETKLKMDGPFAVKISFDPADLENALSEAAPIGSHLHDQSIPYKNSDYPRSGGRLKAWFKNRGNWNITGMTMYFGNTKHVAKGKRARMWTRVMLPYAAIQEFGGRVRDAAKRMAYSAYGKLFIRGKRAGYGIQAIEYAKKGLERFANKIKVDIGWSK